VEVVPRCGRENAYLFDYPQQSWVSLPSRAESEPGDPRIISLAGISRR